MAEQQAISELVDEKQAAEILGISVSWLRKRRWNRLPPEYVKLGAAVRYSVDDLRRFLESRRVGTIAER